MAQSNRLFIPLLVGLLVVMLLGPTSGSAVESRTTVTQTLMVPAAAFIPVTDDTDYGQVGWDLVLVSGFNMSFVAPLWFPAPVVKINRITVYAYDNTSDSVICVDLERSRPASGSDHDDAGHICTADSAVDPQVVYTTAISPRQVSTAVQGSFLTVRFVRPGPRLYGVKVTYSYEAGA